ncbi:hypothetical protein U2F10_23875 [Leptothoe sp. EHU-05/26/07-4]
MLLGLKKELKLNGQMINPTDIQIDELPSVVLIAEGRPALEILRIVVGGK